MRQMELQVDRALEQGLSLPYAMIRSYSQVVLGNTEIYAALCQRFKAFVKKRKRGQPRQSR